MIIDLNELSQTEKDFDFTFQPDLEDETAKLVKPVKVAGKLTKHIAQIDVEGKISGEVEIECARCLSPFKLNLEIPFNVAYISPEHSASDKETEVKGDDLEVAVYENEELNLEELVREQILLNLPSQSFCRADCQGLCQQCGANKNLQNCACEEKEIDPRWSALKELKRDT